MYTILILFIIFYLVFSKLGRTAGRTPFPPRPKETDFPVPAEMPDYSEDDAPLSGPWNRNDDVNDPVARKRETFENDPVLVEHKSQRAGDMGYEPDIATCRQQAEKPVSPESVRRQPEPEKFVCPGDASQEYGQGYRKRKRRKNPLAAAFCGKSELLGSMLVGEIIGPRGGYRGKRK